MGDFSICFSEHLTGHPNYLVTDNIYARPVAEELFVGRFCIILLRFKKLMVKVNRSEEHTSELQSH